MLSELPGQLLSGCVKLNPMAEPLCPSVSACVEEVITAISDSEVCCEDETRFL